MFLGESLVALQEFCLFVESLNLGIDNFCFIFQEGYFCILGVDFFSKLLQLLRDGGGLILGADHDAIVVLLLLVVHLINILVGLAEVLDL